MKKRILACIMLLLLILSVGKNADRSMAAVNTQLPRVKKIEVPLTVDDKYSPKLIFVAEVSGDSFHWGVKSIKAVKVELQDGDTTRAFCGDINVWLRSPYEIEYVVNGDFAYDGNTCFTGGVSDSAKINEPIIVKAQLLNATASDNYKYLYKHNTLVLQR